MKRFRIGLQMQLLALMGLALLLFTTMMILLWQRQTLTQSEITRISRQAMHDQMIDALRRRGESTATQLADNLTNPLYYFDLDAIGALARDTLRQPGISYVLVYDPQGRIVHDGSGDIPTYGRPMQDPLAYEVVRARGLHAQWTDDVVDVSSPIELGDQRIGGVRIGFSLAQMSANEERASAGLRASLAELSSRHRALVIALMLSLLALGIGVVWVIQRTLIVPVRRLADAAREIEAGRFGGSVPVSYRNDEVGDLVRAFERMSQSVARHDRDIRRMAYTDALTGLSNRLAFRESLDQRLLELRGVGKQLALLFADIDDFKRVNDTLGHEAGDEVLVQFSTRIRAAVERLGGEDAQLARFGGDEFVILLQSSVLPGDEVRNKASRLAENLVSELSRPIVIHDRQVFLGTSIGITLFPEDASSATMLMKNGDIAMYQAKVAGKNCYRFYSRAMDQAVERRVRMEQELRGAWERGELSVAYQPVYRLVDNRLVGAEALLRWHHPEQGMVSPAVFIDVAEQSGLIESIGPQVLRVACRDAKRWHDEFTTQEPLFVSVNVSPRQLRSAELPGLVEACLKETGLPASQLHVELTETAVIGDEFHASTLLSRLRSIGVKVWLDDFGTGFSGLSHLRRVPVDGVKIDRSFIADVLRDPDDLALTTAIIAMAHSLGITVVAEGVEKEGQYAILRERGCDLAQGYWLGHPSSAQDFARLLI
ncbi:diguanylate cyclase (GGDEF)-like protein [Luteimonas cucumeris]|uniref:Diguanylate cyclase (GGDEF)-like protein n=1 Tax=Luteimonas cucumeris TaxID=985012 RepID=A0A562LBI4_9GAMM|nr:EAL domain-containing protein [Luteimonas cucumeris]TWI05003.1 diguanylate cyclase (GGDEF)-like protein [Luteimonas cucumeris]